MSPNAQNSSCVFSTQQKVPMKISETVATARKSHMRPSLDQIEVIAWGMDIWGSDVRCNSTYHGNPPETFIFRGYSFFMVLGSKGSQWTLK